MIKDSWTSELETGLSEVDLDNRLLLGLIDRVIEASEDTDLAGLKASLVDLQTETLAHFAREERLMSECQYEAAAQHRAEHQQLSAEIQHLIDDLDAGKGSASFIGRFMRNWLLQHIVAKDALFGRAILTQSGATDRRHQGIDTQTPDEELDIFEERRLEDRKPIVWNSKFALGIEEIDAGHRAMIAVFNDILVAKDSADRTRLAILFERLGNTTADHFEHEEKLMSRLNYRYAATHVDEHRKLLDEFAHQVDDWRDNHISAGLLCRFMHRWLLNHIASSDSWACEAISRQNMGFVQP